MDPKYLQLRFGIIAVKKKFATLQQVSKALEVQVAENVSDGKHRLIGDILVDLGFMTQSQVKEVAEAV